MIAQVRAARAEDFDAIAEVWRESAIRAEGVAPTIPPVKALRARIDLELKDGWSLSVAIVDETIVGMLATKPLDAVLDQIFVHPDWQDRGVGRLLLARAVAEMPTGFTLGTAETNVAARAFYEHMGLTLLPEPAGPLPPYPVCGYRYCPA